MQPIREGLGNETPGGPREGEAFGPFYRAEYPRAVGLAYTLLGNLEAAEDVVQETFARLLPRFEGVVNQKAYLRAGIVNGCKDAWGRRQRERDRLAALPRPAPVPPEASELFDVLLRLPYRHRAVLVLRYWANWSEAEIAEALRCRPGAVKSLVSRGLDRLRKEIAQ